MTNQTEGQDSGNKLTGHVYDGIEELDNSLPRWWVNLFYLTIVFSVGYFAYYELGQGPSILTEYERSKNEVELITFAKTQSTPQSSEEDLRALLKSPENIKTGKEIFLTKCASCHGSLGEGGIGPNLTDDYWIHGGKMTEIAKTISEGVLDKGMPPWKVVLKPEEVNSVTAFVKSIRGSNPPNAKGPQGELIHE